jgi:hypothetical protein
MGTQTMTEQTSGFFTESFNDQGHHGAVNVVVRRGAYANGKTVGVHISNGKGASVAAHMSRAEAIAMAQAIIAATTDQASEDAYTFPHEVNA